MSDHIFLFVVFLPFFRFFFTHHVDPFIEDVFDVEASSNSMVIRVYDLPTSHAYVCLLEDELARTKEVLAQTIQDRAYAEN